MPSRPDMRPLLFPRSLALIGATPRHPDASPVSFAEGCRLSASTSTTRACSACRACPLSQRSPTRRRRRSFSSATPASQRRSRKPPRQACAPSSCPVSVTGPARRAHTRRAGWRGVRRSSVRQCSARTAWVSRARGRRAAGSAQPEREAAERIGGGGVLVAAQRTLGPEGYAADARPRARAGTGRRCGRHCRRGARRHRRDLPSARSRDRRGDRRCSGDRDGTGRDRSRSPGARGRIALEHPEIAEVDVNPLILGPSGAVAVDALVVVDRKGAS